ncbi:hypothetical protein GCM10027288_08450 [Bordetella tumbae]
MQRGLHTLSLDARTSIKDARVVPNGRTWIDAAADYPQRIVGMANSAPLPMLSGQRCMMLF